MKVRVRNFKTINDVEVELGNPTILIGPPGAGKSNLLEAISIIGYFGKLHRVAKVVGDDGLPRLVKVYCGLEASPEEIFRIKDPMEVYPYLDYRPEKSPSISLASSVGEGEWEVNLRFDIVDENRLGAEIGVKIGKYKSIFKTVFIPSICEGNISILHQMSGLLKVLRLESRFYSFDRYGLQVNPLSLLSCNDLGGADEETPLCSIDFPVLGEKGANLPRILARAPRIVGIFNEWLREELESEVEVKVLKRRPEVIFFSRDVEVPSNLLSDGLLRLLYYVSALYTVSRIRKAQSGGMILALEEPEAKAFPYGFTLLARHIREAVVAGVRVVLTTHNPMLASMLLDLPTPTRIYYVYMHDGYTRAVRLDVEKLARSLVSVQDLMVMRPSEVAGRFGAGEDTSSG